MKCELQPSSLCSKAERLGSKLSVGMIFLVILVHNMSGAKSVAKKICKKILGAPFKISRQVPGDELEPGPFDGF